MRHLLTLEDLTDDELLQLTAPEFALREQAPLRGTMGLLFQQPSVRTHASFAAAGAQLGLVPVAIAPTAGDATRDQADLADELHQLSMSSTCVVVRAKHRLDPRVRQTVEAPLINAGDGSNEHPTQTLIDVCALRRSGLAAHHRVALVGNLRDHRVHHSLHRALKRMGLRTLLVSPPGLELPQEFSGPNTEQVSVERAHLLDAAIGEVDFVYLTPLVYWNQSDTRLNPVFTLNCERARRALRPGCKVLHPFPRYTELDSDLDGTAFNAYFDQTRCAVPVRTRLLKFLLN